MKKKSMSAVFSHGTEGKMRCGGLLRQAENFSNRQEGITLPQRNDGTSLTAWR
jgi:hypothetical protein